MKIQGLCPEPTEFVMENVSVQGPTDVVTKTSAAVGNVTVGLKNLHLITETASTAVFLRALNVTTRETEQYVRVRTLNSCLNRLESATENVLKPGYSSVAMIP